MRRNRGQFGTLDRALTDHFNTQLQASEILASEHGTRHQAGERADLCPKCKYDQVMTAPTEPQKTKLQQAWDFLERVASYSDYTHDDVSESKILHELQAAAQLIYGDGTRPDK